MADSGEQNFARRLKMRVVFCIINFDSFLRGGIKRSRIYANFVLDVVPLDEGCYTIDYYWVVADLREISINIRMPFGYWIGFNSLSNTGH